MEARRLHVLVGGFVGGIALRSFFDFGPAFIGLLLLVSVGLFAYWFVESKNGHQNTRVIFLASLFLFSASVGVLRTSFAELGAGNTILEQSFEEEIVMEGLVIAEPDEREKNTRLTIRIDTTRLQEEEGNTTGGTGIKVLVTTDLYPVFQYGDRVRLRGTLEKPENFQTDTGREFDYVSYLGKDSIYYQMYFPDIERISQGGGSIVKRTLFSLKRKFLANIKQVIPDPHASLLGGLIVGAKQSLGNDLQEDFRTVGLIHIVVLSGYNITIIAESVLAFFSFFSRRTIVATSLGIVSIILFAIMVGGSATVVRASIMALLVLFARASRRSYSITRALLVAGVIMLIHNPKILIFDPSFQLSFMATVGLIYVAPLIEPYARFIPERFRLREAATATAATQLFVLPLILYMMGTLSLVALPVNLLVLMLIPATMLLGFLTGILGFIHTLLAAPFAWATYGFLSYELAIVDLFAKLPFASITISSFPFYLLILMYALYALILMELHRRVEVP